MTDRITDERLRYHATRSWTPFIGRSYDELKLVTAELLALRARVAVLERVREAAAAAVAYGCCSCVCEICGGLKVALDAAKEAADGS